MKNFRLLFMMACLFAGIYAQASYDEEIIAGQDCQEYQSYKMVDKTVYEILNNDYIFPVVEADSLGMQECQISLQDMDGKKIAHVYYQIHPVSTAQEISGMPVNGNKSNVQLGCDVVSINISPKYQSKKIGTQIMNVVIDHAKNEGCSHVQLFSKSTARKFYESLGFYQPEKINTGRNWVRKDL